MSFSGFPKKSPKPQVEDRFGLLVLYPPPNKEPASEDGAQDGNTGISVDIVAIHGLNGHRINTWAYAPKHGEAVHWLETLLPQRIQNARIMTFGYNADIVNNTSVAGIENTARVLLRDLTNIRDTSPYRSIVFIGHSLGGIIIKKALRIANNEMPKFGPIAKSTKGLVFFSTPHQGSALGDLANFVLAAFSMINTKFIKILRTNSSGLIELGKEFLPLADSYAIVSFWEEDTLPKLGHVIKVVHEHSAVMGLPWEDHSSLGGNHQTICRFKGIEDPRFETVWKAIRGAIHGRVSMYTGPGEERTKEPAFMVPFTKNVRYVGRSQKQSLLKEKLAGHQRLAICGLGGVGKSQDAIDFIYEFKGKVHVFWIHSESATKFEQDYQKIAALLKIPGYDDFKSDIRALVRDWLDSPESGDWILVLDNADNKVDFYPEGKDGLANYIPRSKGKIIITTRDRIVADELSDNNILSKEIMSPEEARQLFDGNYCKRTTTEQELEDDGSISSLLERLGFLPLAIVHVSAYLRKTLDTPASYLQLFNSTRDDQKELLSMPHTDIRREHSNTNSETIMTAFTITFQQIEEQSPLAANLLKLIACVDRQGIPRELLAKGGYEGCDCDVSLSDALRKLEGFFLITPMIPLEGLEHDGGDMYEMHSLVHLSIEASLTDTQGSMDADIMHTSMVLGRLLGHKHKFEHLPIWRVYIPHVSKLLARVKPKAESIVTGIICNSTAVFYLHNARYSEAVVMFRRAIKIFSNSGAGNIDIYKQKVSAMGYLRYAFERQGRWAESEKLGLEVLEAKKRILSENHPETLDAMSHLVTTYLNQGRWIEAEMLGVRVLEMTKRLLGKDDPAMLQPMANLANMLMKKGRWAEAEKLQVQLLKANKRVNGEEHPNTLMATVNLASSIRSQKRLKEAEKLQVQVLEVLKRVQGENHPNTLVAKGNIIQTFMVQGRWTEAEKLQLQVLEASKSVLGEDHPNTLMSMCDLAILFSRQDRFPEAEELQVQVLEARKRVLGEEHPETLLSMANLEYICRIQLRFTEAEEMGVKLLEVRKRVLGEDHPDTLMAMATLVSSLEEQGKWTEAEKLQVQVLEANKRVLGEDHPDTMLAIGNLGIIFSDQGRWTEAEKHQLQFLEARRRVLGEDNPDTLLSLAIYSSTLWEIGRKNEALKMLRHLATRRSEILGENHPDTKSSRERLEIWENESEGEYESCPLMSWLGTS